MKRLLWVAFALLAFGASRASAQDVRYDYDKDKDFSKYKTYKWVSMKDADQPDQLTAKQLTSALDAELATKGFTKTDSDDAAYSTARAFDAGAVITAALKLAASKRHV